MRPSWGMNATSSQAASVAARDAAVLVADHQADVAVEPGLGQGRGVVGQLDRHQAVALGAGRGGGRHARVVPRPVEEALGAERGLAGLHVGRRGGGAGQPQVVDREGGGGAQDRPDVERRLHVVEHQRHPPVGAPPPRAVQALEPGRVELAAHRLTGSRPAQHPVGHAARPAGRPAIPAARASGAASRRPRCFCTTSRARPSSARRPSQPISRSCSAGLPMRIGGLDQMRARTARPRAPRRGRPRGRCRARPRRRWPAVRASARSLTSTAHTVAPGDRDASVRAIGP